MPCGRQVRHLLDGVRSGPIFEYHADHLHAHLDLFRVAFADQFLFEVILSISKRTKLACPSTPPLQSGCISNRWILARDGFVSVSAAQ